ncbi:hypothetical protein AMATHDRAFT_3719 [Amanita thiersii Skay4041]|uniref:Uncharacterized protein n=1 Tax=Amanita thiersii Skay4041 TaxID=703135 RepID=A0A2A9NQP5_9AGAR|nr:hypothetical protein AMATHDRAFT_3719 [Amanita thiersii Skay4041]
MDQTDTLALQARELTVFVPAVPNDTVNFNTDTGVGALGVEFAGTAVTSGSAFGAGISPATLVATCYAMNDTKSANLNGFNSATFVVKTGENRLSRPAAGGQVEAGVLKSQTEGS